MHALALALLTLANAPHGGAPYRGPGETVPPAPQEAAPQAPEQPDSDRVRVVCGFIRTPGPDPSDWSLWWTCNQDRFLNLKAKVHAHLFSWDAGSALTGIGGVEANGPPTLCPTGEQRAAMAAALFQLEARWDDRDVDSAAMLALAKLGLQPEHCRELFARHLDSANPEVRESAVLAYGVLGDPAAYPLLRELLADTEAGRALQGGEAVAPRVRAAAACALALLARADAATALRQRIAADLLSGATVSAARVPGTPVPVAAQLPLTAMACIVALGRMPHADPSRIAAGLLDLHQTKTVPDSASAHLPGTLARLLADASADDTVVASATDLLLGLLDPETDTPADLRRAATLALGTVAGHCGAERQRSAVDALVRAATHEKDVHARRYTSMSLADLAAASHDRELRAEVVAHLIKRLQRASTGDRPWAALALGVLAHETRDAASMDFPRDAALAVRAGFLETRSPGNKAAFALALGLMRHEEAADDLAAALEAIPDADFRGHAALALGLLHSARHKEQLRALLTETTRTPVLLEQAATALALMKDRRRIELLHGTLRDGEQRARLFTFTSAALALGRTGDRGAVTALLAEAEDDSGTPLADAFLAVALGMLGDESELPYAARFAEDLDSRADAGLLFDPVHGTGLLDLR